MKTREYQVCPLLFMSNYLTDKIVLKEECKICKYCKKDSDGTYCSLRRVKENLDDILK